MGLAEVEDELAALCGATGRPFVRGGVASAGSSAVRIVAVSKTWPAEKVASCAYAHGQRAFGENYVDELVAKARLLPEDAEWHYIGRLQTNKVRRLLAPFVPQGGERARLVVQSVASARHADALDGAAARLGYGRGSLRVLVQVNVGGEATKGGVAPGDVAALVDHVRARCPCLRLAGLMAIGSGAEDEFSAMARLRDATDPALVLSMGMSADYLCAVRAGADIVRVGSAVFGARQ